MRLIVLQMQYLEIDRQGAQGGNMSHSRNNKRQNDKSEYVIPDRNEKIIKSRKDEEGEYLFNEDMDSSHKRERIWIVAHTSDIRCEKLSRNIQTRNDNNWDWPQHKSELCGKAYGLPDTVDRLKGLGNSIVPQIAELLFSRIKELLE